MDNVMRRKADPIATALFEALATGEKCLCELKEIIGIPPTWESYDLRMLEDLNAIQSRTRDGYKYYSLTPSRSLWYMRRSLATDEPETVPARRPVAYDSALEHLRRTTPRVSEFEALLRRGC
jgi:DNA-binding transcriptional ArsR family regulator